MRMPCKMSSLLEESIIELSLLYVNSPAGARRQTLFADAVPVPAPVRLPEKKKRQLSMSWVSDIYIQVQIENKPRHWRLCEFQQIC